MLIKTQIVFLPKCHNFKWQQKFVVNSKQFLFKVLIYAKFLPLIIII